MAMIKTYQIDYRRKNRRYRDIGDYDTIKLRATTTDSAAEKFGKICKDVHINVEPGTINIHEIQGYELESN